MNAKLNALVNCQRTALDQLMVLATVTPECSVTMTMVLTKDSVKIVEASWIHLHVIILDFQL